MEKGLNINGIICWLDNAYTKDFCEQKTTKKGLWIPMEQNQDKACPGTNAYRTKHVQERYYKTRPGTILQDEILQDEACPGTILQDELQDEVCPGTFYHITATWAMDLHLQGRQNPWRTLSQSRHSHYESHKCNNWTPHLHYWPKRRRRMSKRTKANGQKSRIPWDHYTHFLSELPLSLTDGTLWWLHTGGYVNSSHSKHHSLYLQSYGIACWHKLYGVTLWYKLYHWMPTCPYLNDIKDDKDPGTLHREIHAW